MSKEFDKKEQPKQFNLKLMAANFMDGIQRHADMLSFNLASRESVEESLYKKRAAAPQLMPSSKRHQNFEQMQAYARDLLIRQVFNDCINLSIAALNNSHFFLAIIKESKGSLKVKKDEEILAKNRHNHFLKSSIIDKFNLLESTYAIQPNYKKTIIGMTIAMKSLIQNNGIIKADYFNEKVNEPLELSIKKVFLEKKELGEEKHSVKIIDEVKTFYSGDTIVLTDIEIQKLLITVASFADYLFKSTARYAEKFSDNLDK